MRDRLIELLKSIPHGIATFGDVTENLYIENVMAEHLLANGVIALPDLKHRQVLYMIYNKTIKPLEVSSYMIRPEFNNLLQIHLHKNGFNGCCTLEDFGKTVFLTKEEAEQALKGGARE